jgi:hypothetical protein
MSHRFSHQALALALAALLTTALLAGVHGLAVHEGASALPLPWAGGTAEATAPAAA